MSRFPNNYLECGYSWTPRGHDLSARCPRCRGTSVKIDYTQAYVGGLLAIGVAGFIAYSAWATNEATTHESVEHDGGCCWIGGSEGGLGISPDMAMQPDMSAPARTPRLRRK